MRLNHPTLHANEILRGLFCDRTDAIRTAKGCGLFFPAYVAGDSSVITENAKAGEWLVSDFSMDEEFTHEHCGIFVSTNPLLIGEIVTEDERGIDTEVLELDLPEQLIAKYESCEGDPQYREFYLPAEVANQSAYLRGAEDSVLTDTEEDIRSDIERYEACGATEFAQQQREVLTFLRDHRRLHANPRWTKIFWQAQVGVV